MSQQNNDKKNNVPAGAEPNNAPIGGRQNNAPAGDKKQIPLRLSSTLYAQIAAWAEEDFRSVNGQIEYILTEAVKKHRGK